MGLEEDLPASAPKPGDVFADRYRIDRVLGVGGMGFVLAATHLHLHQRVALKMLLPALAGDKDIVERFLREGRAAVQIRSEHVARILDVGELRDRTPYIVMEYLDGSDLDAIVEREGNVPFQTAVDWVLEACEAIAEAHALKIVHRDLKPANLFLARDGSGRNIVKVLDFGISKMTGNDGSLAMTKTSAMLGSPLYMSPEQLKSARNVDERADIWALGVILFELITGSPPFQAETLAELGSLVLSGNVPRLVDLAPGIPPGLSGIVATCMKQKPQDRFVSLADFAQAVAGFGGAGAAESALRIVQTLGLPSARAIVAAHVPASDPVVRAGALDRTAAVHDSQRDFAPTLSAGSLSGSSAPAAAAQPVGAITQRSRRGGGAIMAAAVFVAMAASGGVLIYKAKSSGPAAATAASAPSAPPVASSLVPGAEISSASSAPIALASAAVGAPASAAPHVASATTTPRGAGTRGSQGPRHPAGSPNPPIVATVPPAATASAAAPKPTSTSGFAPSPKD